VNSIEFKPHQDRTPRHVDGLVNTISSNETTDRSKPG
jgi:hypothetical protein